MTNKFGVELDRNGYAPSILQAEQDRCFICGKTGTLNWHEVYFGAKNRTRSKNLGCWCALCLRCHRGVHTSQPKLDRYLKKTCERKALEHYGWSIDQFREHFGKNYLDDYLPEDFKPDEVL